MCVCVCVCVYKIALYVGILSPFIIEKLMKAKSYPNGKIFVIIKKQLK